MNGIMDCIQISRLGTLCKIHLACGSAVLRLNSEKRAKAANLDAIHDTVHEMAKDEARHGRAFEGLLNRYFH